MKLDPPHIPTVFVVRNRSELATVNIFKFSRVRYRGFREAAAMTISAEL